MTDLWDDVKQFMLGGNLIEMAIAFLLALTAANVIGALVSGLIMPIINTLDDDYQPFNQLSFNVRGAELFYGLVINSLIEALLVGIVLIVIMRAIYGTHDDEPEDVAPELEMRACPFCLSDIPSEAMRCPYCTSVLNTAA